LSAVAFKRHPQGRRRGTDKGRFKGSRFRIVKDRRQNPEVRIQKPENTNTKRKVHSSQLENYKT
jgi:hypothetical protein